MHYELEPGDVSKVGRHAHDLAPLSSPYKTSSRHARKDSGYDSVLYSSPMTSPPVPVRKPMGEGLKQTVSAQDSTQSCLSHLSQLFVQIKITRFSECKTFIENQPGILKEDANQFLREAARAHRRGDNQYARACVHRGLLIRKCSHRNREERVRLLHNLASGKRSTVSDFFDDLDDSFEAMKSRADTLESPEVASPTTVTTAEHNRHTAPGQQISSTKRPSDYPHIATDTLGALHSFPKMQIGQTPAYKFPANSLAVPTMNELPHGSTAIRTSRHGTNRGSRDSAQSEIEFKGTDGEAESLDPRYRRQRDPGGFFVVGKVFAVLWHENVGLSNEKPGSDVKFVTTIQRDDSTIGRYGERVFSHIRRMVVVRRRYGYCWCVAINTYGGRGVGGKRRANDEDRSHTIIHDSTKEPQRVANEKRIVKEPIAVIMTAPETLQVASRLNYAKVHTVEHNVKVMDVGMVHPTSMPFFEAHWESEVLRK